MRSLPVPSNNSGIVERLLETPQYTLRQAEKSALLLEELRRLTESHSGRCRAYGQILEATQNGNGSLAGALDQIPFVPTRLFKSLTLQSVPDDEVLKVLTSSGTTSQAVSRVVLDRSTSLLQTQALASIITSFIGPKRLPMIIIDSASTLKDRSSMSARGAGVVGLSNFGRNHFYALDSEMRLDVSGLKAFSERHSGEQILIFGFTFMVWQYFYQELRRLNETLALKHAVLIHSGGWKKLADQAVTNDDFKSALKEQAGIGRIHNFYGMVEQVGAIYMECEHGLFHAPNMADVLIRDPRDWSVLGTGGTGAIQTLSVLPRSYPGHSLLTEDVGTVHGVDDCPCGRNGVRFEVRGRVPRAELRGCSDTHAFSRPVQAGSGNIQQFVPEVTAASDVTSLCPDGFFEQLPVAPLDPMAIDFLDEIAAGIFKIPSVKEFPELAALAFWLRKANVHSIIDEFKRTVGKTEVPQPLGVAFHVAPSNVDTIFLYSWALSLLAGNLNLVRVSQNVTPQLDLLLNLLRQVIAYPRFRLLRERNIILTYPHDDHTSRFLSQHADARLVWGGDETVRRLRSFPAKPTTREISFADKVSACLVHAARYVEMPENARAASTGAFYNDAYQFDQMACSSPHFVFFAGTEQNCETASEIFWTALADEVKRRGQHDAMSTTIDKLVGAYELLGRDLDAKWKHGQSPGGPVVMRVPLTALASSREKCGGGFFVESFVADPTQIGPVIQPGDQTLSYIGFTRDEMLEAAKSLSVRGIDRIVPVGQALNFSPVWDGYVLLAELTKRVVVS